MSPNRKDYVTLHHPVEEIIPDIRGVYEVCPISLLQALSTKESREQEEER